MVSSSPNGIKPVSYEEVDGRSAQASRSDNQVLTPHRNRILVRKCYAHLPEYHEGHKFYRHRDGGICIPENYGESTNFAQILAVGSECKEFRTKDVGAFVVCPEHNNAMSRVGDNEEFVVKEDALETLAIFTEE